MDANHAIPLHDSWLDGVSLLELMDFACGEGLFGQGALPEEARGAPEPVETPSASPPAPPPTPPPGPPDADAEQEGTAGLLAGGVQEQVPVLPAAEDGLTPAVLRESNNPPSQSQPRRKRPVPRLDTCEMSTRQRSRVEAAVTKGMACPEADGELLLDEELGELLRFAEHAMESAGVEVPTN